MDTSSTDADVQTTERPGHSRRSVIRVGAAAAWTVPLVQVATAAPALAVSGPKPKLRFLGFSLKREHHKKILSACIQGVKNPGPGAVGQVTVVVRVPKTTKGPFRKSPFLVGAPSSGWTFVGKTGTGPWDFTFISNTGLAAGRSTPKLLFKLQLSNASLGPQVTITATAMATGATSTTTAATTH